MPKPKPDNIVRHEIVLGRSERQLIEDGLLAYQINRISTPLVALLSDASAMGLILGGIATYYGFKFEIPQQGYDSALELYNDFRTQYDAFKETVTDVRQDPIGSIVDLIGSIIPRPSGYGNVPVPSDWRGYGPQSPSGATNPGDLY